MISVNQKELKKSFGFINNLDGYQSENIEVKVYNEDNHLVSMIQMNNNFIKLKAPVVKKDSDISFKMTGTQFSKFLSKFPGNKTRRLELSVDDNKLLVDTYKTLKGKGEEFEEKYEFECTPIRKPRRSSLKYKYTESTDFDSFLEFIKLSESLVVKSKLYSYFNYGKLKVEESDLCLYYADIASVYRMRIPLLKEEMETEKNINTEIEDIDILFNMFDEINYKKLIKGVMDTDVKVGVSSKGILFSSSTIDFLIPSVKTGYPKVDELFKKDKTSIFKIEDASLITLMKKNCQNKRDYKDETFLLKAQYCHDKDLHRNAIVLNKDTVNSCLEICIPELFMHRHREIAYSTVAYSLHKVEKVTGIFYEPEVSIVDIDGVSFASVKDWNKEVLILPMAINAD